MKRLINYLFFLDPDFKLDKIIPIKNIAGIYQEEEFVENLFKDLLESNDLIKLTLNKDHIKGAQTLELGYALGNLSMEIFPLEFTVESESSWLVTFLEGAGSNKPETLDSPKNGKSSLEYVDEFSHEIKNSVNIIHGISDLMNSSEKDELSELIPTLSASVQHLKGLVTNYLLNRKHENMKWERVEFDLQSEMESIIKQFKYLNKSISKEIKLQVDSRLPSRLIGFPAAMRQVLINLVSNAIEHTEKGEVVLELKLVREEFDEIVLKFSVSDSGDGIQEEVLKKLFKKFQFSSIEKNGFGLGLNISKGILSSLQSDLMVSTEIGKGSNFYFELPFHKPVIGSFLAGNSNDCTSNGVQTYEKRALIVDDDHLNRLVATKKLTKFGLHCESASNGVLAIQKLYDSNYDLLILDIHLPLIDGYTLYNLVQNRFPNLKVIFSTGSSSSSVLEIMKNGQSKSVLLKPYSQEDLSQVLEREFSL